MARREGPIAAAKRGRWEGTRRRQDPPPTLEPKLLFNPQARNRPTDHQLLDLRRAFEDRVGRSGVSVLFGVVL